MAARKRTASQIAITVDARTADLTDEALECRESNHSWLRLPADAKRRPALFADGLYESVRQCQRCTTKRTDIYVIRTGELDSRSYDYPDGYCIKDKGTGYLHVAEVRKAHFARENPDLVRFV
jgi:hypothetical protein